MEKKEHPLFGEVIVPDSFLDLIKIVSGFNIKFDGVSPENIRMWRGQADITWPIHSSAYRRLSIVRSVVTEEQMRVYEKQLIERARHKGHDWVGNKKLKDFELLAKIQHYGGATRLVDASRNALVALYFAVSDLPQNTGLLMGVHTWLCGGNEGYDCSPDYENQISDLENYSYPQTWEPTEVTSRVAAQHSQFLYSSVVEAPMGSLCLHGDDPKAVIFISIHPELKTESVRILRDTFDIHRTTLFPDIEGFSTANSHRSPMTALRRW